MNNNNCGIISCNFGAKGSTDSVVNKLKCGAGVSIIFMENLGIPQCELMSLTQFCKHREEEEQVC